MYDVLIIEDCRKTGSLLTEYLTGHVPRLTTASDPREVDRDPKTQTRYPAAHGEPGQGQLRHLCHAFDALHDNEKIPRAHLYPPEDLGRLGAAAANQDERSGFDELRRVIRECVEPQILVVDLALLPNEAERMHKAGGDEDLTDQTRGPVKNPRQTLRKMTGFKVLQAYALQCPVIVTTYSRSPLVQQHCRVNGAYAVVQKPVLARAQHKFDLEHATPSIKHMEAAAKRNQNPLDVLVTQFATAAVAEVLKALAAVMLREG